MATKSDVAHASVLDLLQKRFTLLSENYHQDLEEDFLKKAKEQFKKLELNKFIEESLLLISGDMMRH